jgi:hypothetical protein
MPTDFGITFDYLCPFARNANEHVIEALTAGADWEVTFTPYSLAQGHVEEGDPDVWDTDDPSAVPGILALQVGLAVRDHFPDRFLDAHVALFAARHDEGADIKDEAVLRRALESAGLEPDAVFELVRGGEPLESLRKEHERNVNEHGVWGVPTFVAGGRSVFVRLLDRPEGDADRATDRITRVVDLVLGFPELHEFKQADLPV